MMIMLPGLFPLSNQGYGFHKLLGNFLAISRISNKFFGFARLFWLFDFEQFLVFYQFWYIRATFGAYLGLLSIFLNVLVDNLWLSCEKRAGSRLTLVADNAGHKMHVAGLLGQLFFFKKIQNDGRKWFEVLATYSSNNFIGSYLNFYKININIDCGPIPFRGRSYIEKISLMAYAGENVNHYMSGKNILSGFGWPLEVCHRS